MDQQYYGLTEAGEIVLLPKAEYSSSALLAFIREHEQAGKTAPTLQLILSEEAYQVVYSHLEAELEDRDGDGQVPHYLCLAHTTQLPVFPHPSVDTEEELQEFFKNYPTALTTGVRLTDAKAKWPVPNWPDVSADEKVVAST